MDSWYWSAEMIPNLQNNTNQWEDDRESSHKIDTTCWSWTLLDPTCLSLLIQLPYIHMWFQDTGINTQLFSFGPRPINQQILFWTVPRPSTLSTLQWHMHPKEFLRQLSSIHKPKVEWGNSFHLCRFWSTLILVTFVRVLTIWLPGGFVFVQQRLNHIYRTHLTYVFILFQMLPIRFQLLLKCFQWIKCLGTHSPLGMPP